MKTLEVVVLRCLQVVSIGLLTIAVVAIGYAIMQIVIGNVHSTSVFEF